MDITRDLAEQMAALGRLGPPFAEALERARQMAVSGDFLRDGFSLLQQLSGRPGAGAPDCLRDAPKDLASTQAFLRKWASSRRTGGYDEVLREAERTAQALTRFNDTIQRLNPSQRRNVQVTAEMGHDVSRILRGEVPRSAWIGGILVVAVIVLIAVIVITALR